MPYGYAVSYGYFGLVGSEYVLFPTENEYYEYLLQTNLKEDTDNG